MAITIIQEFVCLSWKFSSYPYKLVIYKGIFQKKTQIRYFLNDLGIQHHILNAGYKVFWNFFFCPNAKLFSNSPLRNLNNLSDLSHFIRPTPTLQLKTEMKKRLHVEKWYVLFHHKPYGVLSGNKGCWKFKVFSDNFFLCSKCQFWPVGKTTYFRFGFLLFCLSVLQKKTNSGGLWKTDMF